MDIWLELEPADKDGLQAINVAGDRGMAVSDDIVLRYESTTQLRAPDNAVYVDIVRFIVEVSTGVTTGVITAQLNQYLRQRKEKWHLRRATVRTREDVYDEEEDRAMSRYDEHPLGLHAGGR